MMSTVQFKAGSHWEANPTRQTTREAPEIHEQLARMQDMGVTHAVVESSSHGLALRKLDHCAFDAAIVTNVAADHLDFHGTREAYLAAKARLLELTGASPAKPGRGLVVLNADDRSHDELRPLARGKVISFGIERAADLRGQVQEATALGSRVRLHGRLGEAALWVPVPGSFNVANALGAIACAVGLGVRLERACAALAGFRGVPGRMEPVNAGQPFAVIVDYAHTDSRADHHRVWQRRGAIARAARRHGHGGRGPGGLRCPHHRRPAPRRSRRRDRRYRAGDARVWPP
jgi:UDP-N-acetylmuramoyl-L-alanyl-D-glutamate--2,6-diaminopimelate ligase